MMQARYGKIAEERAKIAEALLSGQDFKIGMKKVRGGNNSSDKLWRNCDPANPMGDDFRRKAVRIFERLPAPSDAQDATSDEKDSRCWH